MKRRKISSLLDDPTIKGDAKVQGGRMRLSLTDSRWTDSVTWNRASPRVAPPTEVAEKTTTALGGRVVKQRHTSEGVVLVIA